MERIKKKRQLFQILNIILCIAMIINRVTFGLSVYLTSSEKEISAFVFISVFTWLVLIGACLFHGTYHQYFDEYTDEELLKKDKFWKEATKVSAVTTKNVGMYLTAENMESMSSLKEHGGNMGTKQWNAYVLLIAELVIGFIDILLLVASGTSVSIFLAILFVILEICFIFTTENFRQQNELIAKGETKYTGHLFAIYMVYFIAFIIGHIPYLVLFSI